MLLLHTGWRRCRCLQRRRCRLAVVWRWQRRQRRSLLIFYIHFHLKLHTDNRNGRFARSAVPRTHTHTILGRGSTPVHRSRHRQASCTTGAAAAKCHTALLSCGSLDTCVPHPGEASAAAAAAVHTHRRHHPASPHLRVCVWCVWCVWCGCTCGCVGVWAGGRAAGKVQQE